MRALGVVATVLLVAASAASASTPGTNGAILFTQPRCPGWATSGCTAPPQPCAVDPVTRDSFVPALPVGAVPSPDGRRYAFGAKRKGVYRLLVANADGTSERAIAPTDGAFGPWPSWSPDGSRLAFVGTAPTNPPPLLVADLATGAVERLASPAFQPSWAPDGKELAVVAFDPGAQQVIGAVDPATGKTRLVTSEPGGATQPADSEPDWSPDSARIAFTHLELGTPARVETVAGDGTGRRVLTAGSSPSWAPDGSRIALVRDGAVWTMAADGSAASRLSAVPDILAQRPTWLDRTQTGRLRTVGNCDLAVAESGATYEGGNGVDTFVVTAPSAAVYGDAGNDLFVVGPPRRRGSVLLDGGAGDDEFELYGFAGNVTGGDGNDRLDALLDGLRQNLSGGAGNDWIRGGSANDTVDGGPGNDLLFGGTGANTIHGGGGNDTVSATAGSRPQQLFGGPGNDRVLGGAGADLLYGGTGRDRIEGRGGNDVIHVQDRVRDVVDCGAGRDTVYADRVDAVARNCERVVRAR